MPSETFFCPHCHRQLTKSAQAYVLGEIMQNKNSSYVGLGAPVQTVTCPGCGRAIDSQRMMRGDYDGGTADKGTLWGILAGIPVAIAASYYGDLPWWAGALAGLVAAGAVGMFVSQREARRRAG